MAFTRYRKPWVVELKKCQNNLKAGAIVAYDPSNDLYVAWTPDKDVAGVLLEDVPAGSGGAFAKVLLEGHIEVEKLAVVPDEDIKHALAKKGIYVIDKEDVEG